MGWFKKKLDPITAREQELEKKLARLRAEIQQLDAGKNRGPKPRVRSTVHPNPAPFQPPPPEPVRAPSPADPIFEEVDLDRAKPETPVVTSAHYNEQGLRKYDLVAAWQKLRAFFQRADSPSSNPKLIKYLAAGKVDGIKTLRIEKRVARRRFIVFFTILLLILLGLVSAYMRR